MILFVDQSGQLGGAELALADLVFHRRAEARVVLFTEGPFAQLLRARGVPVAILPLPANVARVTKQASPRALMAGAFGFLSHAWALRREIHGCHIVYFNTAKALLHGAAANFPHKRPAIFHLHDILDSRHFSASAIRLLVTAANRMDAVIANSSATAEAFAAAGGRTRTEIIPNGLNAEPFDAVTPETVATLRATLNPKGQPVAAIFGRLTRWKGQDILIRAAAQIPDLQVWIVGDALFTGDDRAYADELRALATPLAGRVRFLGFREDIPALMKACDVVVHCSTAPEPFGRVIVEGMLARRPVVAVNAGGPPEILGDCGRLIPAGDVHALVETLRALLASPSERALLAEAGRQRALRDYALPSILARQDAILDRFL